MTEENRRVLYVGTYLEGAEIPLLKHEGFICDRAETRNEAVLAAERAKYCGALITSLRIGAGDCKPSKEYCGNGLELIRDLSEKGLPMVVLTGASKEVRMLARVNGAQEVLSKPLPLEEWMPVVKRTFL